MPTDSPVMNRSSQHPSCTRSTLPRTPRRASVLVLWLAATLGLSPTVAVQAGTEDSLHSISYWKPFVIPPGQDAQVARAQRVFQHLLRAWDGTRVQPTLQVVKSSQGPWAASLADGNILLSRAAIEVARAQGEAQADHLLAFVLAHELAHQRADDLWHHKFFRLVGSQSPEARQTLLRGLEDEGRAPPDLERREAQADHDGLILMATVGYDPFTVVDREGFFTRWVESVWAGPCEHRDAHWAGAAACAQAVSRAARGRAQLASVATQATLFELGIQATAAGHWAEARRLFIAFGREYPSRAVHTNIGLTHLAEALQLRPSLGKAAGLPFFIPLQLETRPEATPLRQLARARGAPSESELQLYRQHLSRAARSFERAIRLEPGHRGGYLLLAMSYLLEGNTPMARGVLQGKYLPLFGEDPQLALLLAMTRAGEGDLNGARADFDALLETLETQAIPRLGWSRELLIYTAFHNAAVLAEARGDHVATDELWRRVARLARETGRQLLFQVAVERVRPNAIRTGRAESIPRIRGARLGDRVNASVQADEFWLEGEALKIYRFKDGARWVVNEKGRLISAWQHGDASLVPGLRYGDRADRPLKALGPPTRRVELVSGAYLAYDRLGLAIHIERDRVSGWFLYRPEG